MELLENKGFLLLPTLPVKYRTMLSGYGPGRGTPGSRDPPGHPFTKTKTARIGREIEDPAHWLRLELTLPR